MRRNPNAWRYNLDPRDPEYVDPPETVEDDEEPPLEEAEPVASSRYDPRVDGPYHYQPPREP